MDERTRDRHSVNCYFCGEEYDERDCVCADPYNGNDGGSICPTCLAAYQAPYTEESRQALAEAIVDAWDYKNLVDYAVTRLMDYYAGSEEGFRYDLATHEPELARKLNKEGGER